MAEHNVISTESAADKLSKDNDQGPKKVYLVPYPSIIFLYPTLFLSIVAGTTVAIMGPDWSGNSVMSMAFLLVFGINMVVLAFDFPRTTSITWFAVLAAIGMGLTLLFKMKPDWLPLVSGIFTQLNPYANATFYFVFATLLGAIFVAMLIAVNFDYWEVRPNELLHHHGVLSNLRRYSTSNLQIEKDINDLLEYGLLRSGRLILHPKEENRSIVLNNVLSINRKEHEITQVLGALQVRVRTDSDE